MVPPDDLVPAGGVGSRDAEAGEDEIFVFPASFGQRRLWFLEQLDPGRALNNIPLAVRLAGALDAGALEAGLRSVIERHESLRTALEVEDGEPVQVVGQGLPFAFARVDLGAVPAECRAAALAAGRRREAQRPFTLTRAPLMRAVLWRLDAREHVLLVTLHHAVSDGWSSRVLLRDLAAFYGARLAGATATLPELPIQYADFTVWQRERLRGPALDDLLAYWRERLAGVEPLELPADRARYSGATPDGARRAVRIEATLRRRIEALGRHSGTTPFAVLLAAWQALLGRMSGQQRFCVGTPVAGRERLELEPLVGFLVNMLPLVADLSGSPRVRQLLDRVHEVVTGARAHQELPFERLIEELDLDREADRPPLFQVALVLHQDPPERPRLPGLELELLASDTGLARYELTLELFESEDGYAGTLEYRTALFDAATAERMVRHFSNLLAAAVGDPSRPVARLPYLSVPERHQLLVEWNAGAGTFDAGAFLHRRFEVAANCSPEAVAVVDGDRWLSYGVLERDSNRLAHHLRVRGVTAGDLVGLCLAPGLHLAVAVLGVHKSGAAYLPLDPDYPRRRLAAILEDAAPKNSIAPRLARSSTVIFAPFSSRAAMRRR